MCGVVDQARCGMSQTERVGSRCGERMEGGSKGRGGPRKGQEGSRKLEEGRRGGLGGRGWGRGVRLGVGLGLMEVEAGMGGMKDSG